MKEYLENRIAYLKKEEAQALLDLDELKAGTAERLGKWELIKYLTERRRELEDAKAFLINCNNPVVVGQREQLKMFENMQYYMEHCEREGYVTPQEWIEKHKHF